MVANINFFIRLSKQDDFLQIHELLRRNGLSIEGVNSDCGSYYVAFNQEVIGVIGIESYGAVAMLRSLVVNGKFRKSGIAKELIYHALQVMNLSGVTDVYLLTNTAEEYMTRYGFFKINRDEVPDHVLTSSALGNVCPSSSTCMKLTLK